jgi:hypothetical protein
VKIIVFECVETSAANEPYLSIPSLSNKQNKTEQNKNKPKTKLKTKLAFQNKFIERFRHDLHEIMQDQPRLWKVRTLAVVLVCMLGR